MQRLGWRGKGLGREKKKNKGLAAWHACALSLRRDGGGCHRAKVYIAPRAAPWCGRGLPRRPAGPTVRHGGMYINQHIHGRGKAFTAVCGGGGVCVCVCGVCVCVCVCPCSAFSLCIIYKYLSSICLCIHDTCTHSYTSTCIHTQIHTYM